jgi:hypothetical protein
MFESFKSTPEQEAEEHYQLCEKDGEIWIKYDQVPIVPESLLAKPALETLKELRRKYVEAHRS